MTTTKGSRSKSSRTKTATGTKKKTGAVSRTETKTETRTGTKAEARNRTLDFRLATSPARAEAWDSAWTGLAPTTGAGARQGTSKPTPDVAASAKVNYFYVNFLLLHLI